MTAHKPAAQVVRDAAAGRPPRVGIVLGSGLADIAGFIEQSIAIPYEDLPGFPVTTVEGHTGKLVIGDWAGTRVACMQGRFHVYEGHDPVDLALPIRTLGECGCDILLLTCAAGSLQENMPPGSLVMLSDHINWSGVSPLAGPNDDSIGPRFVDLNRAYDPELRALLHESAREVSVALHDGIYIWCLGPNFETPAEIRAFRTLGADIVGMSTVPECLVARHCGMRVAAISVITNFAAGMQEELFNEETLAAGAGATPRLCRC
jgi:xanthosine phosphorylase